MKVLLPIFLAFSPFIFSSCDVKKTVASAKGTMANEILFPYQQEGFGAGNVPTVPADLADMGQIADSDETGPGDEDAKAELNENPELAAREENNDDENSFGGKSPSQWRAAKSLFQLRSQLLSLAPQRNKKDDGMVGDPAHQGRSSDHNPWVKDAGIGVVTAYDITHSPSTGCNAGILAESLIKSKDSRIKYVIWNSRIAGCDVVRGTPAWTWRPYTGSNHHDKHMHLSVLPSKNVYDDARPWSIRIN